MLYLIVIVLCFGGCVVVFRKHPFNLQVGLFLCLGVQTALYLVDFCCRYFQSPEWLLAVNEVVRLLIYTIGPGFSALVLLIYAATVLDAETFNRSHQLALAFGILFIGLVVAQVVTFVTGDTRFWWNVYLDLACALANYICFMYCAYFITSWLYRRHMRGVDVRQFDYFLVLGHRLDGANIHPILERRLDLAFQLWNEQGRTCKIILSGGQCFAGTRSEASAMQEYLLGRGVPEDMMILEDSSTTTRENLENTRRLMEGVKSDYRCLLITGNFHLIRGLMNAEFAGVRAEGVAASNPVDPLFVGLSTREMMSFIFTTKVMLVIYGEAMLFLEAWRYVMFAFG